MSLLKNLFGEQQMATLADYVQASLMLNYNGRNVGCISQVVIGQAGLALWTCGGSTDPGSSHHRVPAAQGRLVHHTRTAIATHAASPARSERRMRKATVTGARTQAAAQVL